MKNLGRFTKPVRYGVGMAVLAQFLLVPATALAEGPYVEVNTDIKSTAQSEDSSTTSNNALVMANILSMVQSSWGVQGGDVSTFTTEINGNVVGDMDFDPNQLQSAALPEGSANTIDLGVDVKNSGTINNNIDLVASSGDAIAAGNDSTAASGTAAALINIMNVINSTITAGRSFVGNININGNFEGDILLPKEMRDQLVQSTPPTTTLSVSDLENPEALQGVGSTATIRNTVSLEADGGTATGNTASQGASNTSFNLYNLTGAQVIGKNALLVFVNVLGEWVGMIVDAPAGAKSAMVGDGTATQNQAAPIEGAHSNTINNNISVTAQSGDANAPGGNAQSGTAKASASVLDIANSNFSLADWFGVLFINVLGTWHGSFGIDTVMGDAPSTTTPPQVSGVQVFELTPASSGKLRATPAAVNKSALPAAPDTTEAAAPTPTTPQPEETPKVLGATTAAKTATATKASLEPANTINPWLIGACISVALLLFGIERGLTARAARKN